MSPGMKPSWGGNVWTANSFGYNARSELDVAVMGTNQFGYQYAAIGNRQAAIADVFTNVYEDNARCVK